MKSKFILTIGLLAIVVGIATTGIAIKSVQAVTSDPDAIKEAAKRATANSLILTSQQLTSNPNLSDLAKSTITSKLGSAITLLGPFENGGIGGNFPGCGLSQCPINENGP